MIKIYVKNRNQTVQHDFVYRNCIILWNNKIMHASFTKMCTKYLTMQKIYEK